MFQGSHLARARGVFPASVLALAVLAVAGVAGAAEIVKGVSVNAHLTQAWGKTDGLSLLGLTEEGTFDYGTAALLFRFEISSRDQIVVQLAHERLGRSPVADLRDEIELDWAFYQRRFDSGARLRVGRFPIPFGIYNEIRDVGTVLEFFRPPAGLYLDSSFSSETVDGVSLSYGFFSETSWPLDIDVYAGSWERIEFVVPDLATARAEDAFGTQLWLGTPIPGLRCGLAWQRFDSEGGLIPRLRLDTTRFETRQLSLDGDFDRFILRGEFQRLETEFIFSPETRVDSYFALFGYKFTEDLSVHLQFEDSKLELGGYPAGFPSVPPIDPFYRDLAASLIYQFSPQLLLRAELHHAKSAQPDIELPPGADAAEVDFGILSFSASF